MCFWHKDEFKCDKLTTHGFPDGRVTTEKQNMPHFYRFCTTEKVNIYETTVTSWTNTDVFPCTILLNKTFRHKIKILLFEKSYSLPFSGCNVMLKPSDKKCKTCSQIH